MLRSRAGQKPMHAALLVDIAELLEEHPHLADVSVAGFLLQAVTG